MLSLRLLIVLLVATVAVAVALPNQENAREKRQLADDDALQPLDDITGAEAEQNREKRKLEGVTQAKFSVKNALLGFVFGHGTLSQHHINKMAAITTRNRRNSPLLQHLTTGRQWGTISENQRGKWPDTLRGIRQKRGVIGARLPRQTPTTKDGIPIFDRNKVSLDFPGSLFGPSVSLLIKSTKVIGEVIQNSAVRYQTFLRLFRPLFRGPFEIKGLDPATTTTTTTTTEAPAQNEVRRR